MTYSRIVLPFLLLAVVASSTVRGAEAPSAPALIPSPLSIKAGEGVFTLTSQTVLQAATGTEKEAEGLAATLRTATGFALPVAAQGSSDSTITLKLDAALESKLGPEGYLLSVKPTGVTIQAATAAGLFYGGVTFKQLLPAEIFGKTLAKVSWSVPCLDIEDSPRFVWRGLMLDVSRHYFPPEDVKKMLDLMAMHKMNTMHWHLTDDQGWRVEIKKYPRLTEIGSIRKESPVKGDRNRGDGKPYGPYFYTQDQIRDIVAYAEKLHITVVPEIEMPGHVLGVLAAFPELSCRGVPINVRTRWGVEDDVLCVGNEKSLEFMKDILNEVLELFPSKFIHIGGDESPRTRWKTCPKCQALLKKEGLKHEAELQTWFNHRIEKYLADKGRRLIGWDEILEGGLTPGAAVMSWRGMGGGVAAAKAGHDVVMSPTSHCYFDYGQGKGPNEPECIGGVISLRTVYEFEPVPASLSAEGRKHILGAQGNLWTEYIYDQQVAEYFGFPRASALAEVAWSPAKTKNFEEFCGRLERHLKRLDQLKVNYRKLDPLPLGKWDPKSVPNRAKASQDFPIPAKLIAKPGTYEVEVSYQSGRFGMYFDGVELLANGKTIAKDPHRAFTGHKSQQPVFTLEVPEISSDQTYVLRMNFDSTEGTDSHGVILWRLKNTK